jgi:hypothetical protein
MTRGVRYIDGREYLLAGRTSDHDSALSQAKAMRAYWQFVRVVKLCAVDFMLYVHGAK